MFTGRNYTRFEKQIPYVRCQTSAHSSQVNAGYQSLSLFLRLQADQITKIRIKRHLFSKTNNKPLILMLYRSIFLSSLVFLIFISGQPLAAVPGKQIVIDDLPLLFVDDNGIESRTTVTRTFHPAERRENPVLEADKPWEIRRVYAWGSVYFDESKDQYQMWYLARVPPDERTNLLYATSPDGVTWEKPSLGLHEIEGSSANNVFDVGGGGSATVIVDEHESDPQRRYKMIAHRKGGYHALHSGDGIHWKPYPENPILTSGDTVMLAQNPATGAYLAYHKRPATIRGFPRRVVWLSQSMDFQKWSEPVLVFAPDAEDDNWPKDPTSRMEVYDMPVFAHAAGYVGFPAMFQHFPQELDGSATGGGGLLSTEGGAVTATGPIDIQLATSRDGIDWKRSYPRLSMIPRGAPGTYDGGSILNTATFPVHTSDQTWVYYTAINTGHGAPIPPKAISVGRAEWRLHGFASLDAGPEGGTILTKSLRFNKPVLVLNVDASIGEVRVELQDADGRPLKGFTFEESEALTGDHTAIPAKWRKHQSIPTDSSLRVAIKAYNTRLYSISCRENP
jgi:hypothetical protein